ncbi:1-acyl-sn-glycerol-3-phosphate acyltransferase [Campylobacter sp. FMV-PI01]|uniref:1-acyl-sn-glycerol-3-phosphate acyltransferase n=2 Tax=Campylobacter portucalensis TaxID=2608384 RepID=A0A6L5WKD9_9BACT|nr:1-acyl-sn-glycerol-3-phosphate acyltransferase [Campylobacter portucalensis]
MAFRIFLVGFLFFVFGFICMIGNLIFIPILLLRLYKFNKVQNFSRFLVRHSWRLFLFFTEILGYQKSNKEILKGIKTSSSMIICNHPSLLDVVFFLSNIKGVNCVVKSGLRKNIFLYPAIKSSGYITNSNDSNFLNKCIDVLKNGENLVVFPEGSRTKDEIYMQKGAFYIAVRGAKNLILVTLEMNPLSLRKDQKWYETPKEKIVYKFSIKDKIELSKFESDKIDTIRTRKLNEEINKFYKKEIR